MEATTANLITGLVAGLGVGTAITALIQFLLERRKTAQESQRKELEARYRVVILLMHAAVDFEGNQSSLRTHRPDLKTKQSVIDELRAEWVNMILFASSTTLDSLHTLIRTPTPENLISAAQAMRADLGRGKVNIGDTGALEQNEKS
jgi:nucleoside-diphosphate-sugar epimerase